MARKLTVTALMLVIYLAGCARPYEARTHSSRRTTGMLARTMERLQSENLPTLQAVEVWQNAYGPGLKLTTDHYDIFTTMLEPLMLRTIPGFIESAYWGYNDQLPQPIETVARFKIYLFADRRQWQDFTYAFAGEQAPVFCKSKTVAYYLNDACVVYNLGPDRTLSALGHEGWHQFASRHFRYRLPSWLDEGVAMLFETSTFENGMFLFNAAGNYQRLGALSETLGSTRLIPLHELVTTSPGEVLAMDQTEAVMAFYSQSYALVRFLREAGDGKRLTRYHRMLWDGMLGEWPLDPSVRQMAEDRNLPRTIHWNRLVGARLFERYVGEDFEQLQSEYLAYCRSILHGLSFARADDWVPTGIHQ